MAGCLQRGCEGAGLSRGGVISVLRQDPDSCACTVMGAQKQATPASQTHPRLLLVPVSPASSSHLGSRPSRSVCVT